MLDQGGLNIMTHCNCGQNYEDSCKELIAHIQETLVYVQWLESITDLITIC